MNTNPYCLVNVPTADTVLQGPQLLPQNWQDPAGNWYMNLNNNAAWSDTELLALGWYPYVESDVGAPGPYYSRSLSDFVVNPTNVVRNAIYTQWPIEDVRRAKDDEMALQLRVYQANEAAINPKVKEYVRDDAKWYSVQQAELARLTDWADVAAFDTTKPTVLVLPNSFVAQSYVEQGLAMEAENSAAVGQGLAEKWDPTDLNAFVTANQLAASDHSDSTVPVQPGFRLRQGVAVPSEQFARVIIFRKSRDDPNPALRTTYEIKILNREDARNLYIFSYTGLTYLAWHQFMDQGRGVWGVEAHSSEWQYVPGDMAFIFSYGTNPAVEADYFTDRIEFPAGVQTQTVLVAWDTE